MPHIIKTPIFISLKLAQLITELFSKVTHVVCLEYLLNKLFYTHLFVIFPIGLTKGNTFNLFQMIRTVKKVFVTEELSLGIKSALTVETKEH